MQHRLPIIAALAVAAIGAAVLASTQTDEPPGRVPTTGETTGVSALTGPRSRESVPPTASSPIVTMLSSDMLARAASAHWIAIGGGPTPDGNQIQIEQDIGLAAKIFPGVGVTAFAAGPSAPTVQVRGTQSDVDPVSTALGNLFAPRSGRDSNYRHPQIAVDVPAQRSHIDALLTAAAGNSTNPLLIYIAGHGELGEQPADNAVALWGQSSLTVRELARVFDRGHRPVRAVITTCYSGGFAEFTFVDASRDRGLSAATRCGLFASTWDLEASGCDPDPERSAQEGYGIHFLSALRGQDRDGRHLDLNELDFNGDGFIGLLDAHTRVRIASRAADVPTTTSELWLREHAPTHGPMTPLAMPEEQAVVAALAARLGLTNREREAFSRLRNVDDELRRMAEALATEHDAEDDLYRRATGDILARWPILNDPWHPEFHGLITQQHAQLGAYLEDSASYLDWAKARDRVSTVETAMSDLATTAAELERLVRALETIDLGQRLAARGGSDFATWERLVECERSAP